MCFHRAFRRIFASLLALMWVASDVAGQTDAKQIAQEIRAVEQILLQDPAAASLRFQQLIAGYPRAADSTKSLLYLKLSTSLGMTGKMDSAIWAVREALRFSPNDHIYKAEALRVLAILYRLQGKYDQAEDAIRKSLHLHNSLLKNPVQKSVTLQEYGSLALDQSNYAQAIALFLEALEILQDTALQDAHKQITIPKLRINLAEAYMNSGDYDLAIREFELARPILDSLGDREGYVRTVQQLATMYVSAGKYLKADTLLNKIYPLAEKLQNEELKAYITSVKADLQAAQGRYAPALLFYRKAYAIMTKNKSAHILECVNPYLEALAHTGGDTEARQVISAALVKAALESARPATVLQYKRNAIKFLWRDLTPSGIQSYHEDLLQLSDSIHREEKRKADREARTKYQLDRLKEFEAMLQTENALLKERAGYKRSQLLLSIALGLLTCLVLLMIVLRLRQRARSQAELEQARYENLKESMMAKGRELTGKALLIAHIDEQMDLIRIKMIELMPFYNQPAQEPLQELIRTIEKSKSTNAWEEFEQNLAEINSPLYKKLLAIAPRLTPAELQICGLIAQNQSTKDIAILTNRSKHTIDNIRYTLRKKLDLNTDDNLAAFIRSL